MSHLEVSVVQVVYIYGNRPFIVTYTAVSQHWELISNESNTELNFT